MSNSFITPSWVLKDVARVLVNNLKFAANVDRSYDDKFRVGGAKVGYTVSARLPQRFRTTKGQAFQAQAINDSTVPVTLTDQANIGTSWSTADATMIVEDVRKRYVNPAAEQLANTIDYDGLTRSYIDVYNSVGTPGTVPTSNETYLNAGVLLSNGACPEDGRVAVLPPAFMAKIANANIALFGPRPTIDGAFRKGQFANDALAIEKWFQDQNVATHTTGTFTASTPLVFGASQTGSSLATDGWASGASTLKQGDIFTIGGVYSINPQSYASTGQLQQFVVTADISDTTGSMTIPISPSIITSGQLQTVSNSPANDAVITVLGATSASAGTLATTISRQGLVYHPEAFILAMADLDDDLDGAKVERVNSKKLNVSLRYVRQYSAMTDQKAARIDCIYGYKTFRPELACRVWG